MKSLLALLSQIDRSNSPKQNRSLLSPFISRSIGISLNSWLLGISIVTAIPLGSIVGEVQPAQASGFPITVATPGTDRIGANGAIVELYDSAGNFFATTTTDAQGRYGFSQNIKVGSYFVRVVNSSVKSVRPGGTTATGLMPVQTFQTDGATGLATPVTNLVGGKDLTQIDSVANTTNQNLSAIFAQSVSKVVVVENDAVPDTDFGFNLDTIVNAKDSGQGSFRQFILRGCLESHF